MSGRMVTTLLAVGMAVVFVCLTGPAILFGGAAAGCDPHGRLPSPASRHGWPAVGPWDREQVGHAATIISVGSAKNVPRRGWVIAVATAMQESTLRNLASGDRDSVGLFQQRPSQGWGTPSQLRDPAYAAGKFYDKLLTIPNWQTMPLTEAAQRVQISAYPDAYAKWEPDANLIVDTIAGLPTPSAATVPGHCDIPSGAWTQPVRAVIGSGFRTTDRPGHDGVDLIAPRGTTIRAASTGTVTRARCNAIDTRDGSDWGCHRDGHPILTKGCGWYVDIAHPGGIMTRYCHLDNPPLVTVGDQVAVGQPIGVVGTTGHSSGPHLHFEVHANGDHGSRAAQDPVRFMIEVGAPL
ncbi:M23 family metallopeptidase [Polymorphospora sp. NPDC051019]|uniref:M23 family metallopeptidase n=1 Tax=Polymorphospora sp. NPDC051019 TaxID=3155725 RepID=UPI003423C9BD